MYKSINKATAVRKDAQWKNRKLIIIIVIVVIVSHIFF